MSTRAPKLVRNDVQDTSKDYKDLLEEMKVKSEAQQEVFELIKQFRDKPHNLRNVRLGSKAAHTYLNTNFFNTSRIARLAEIEMLSQPLRNIMDKDKKDEIMASVTPVVNRLWLRMRDIIFQDSTVQKTKAHLNQKLANEAKPQTTRSSRKRTAAAPICRSPGAADRTETRSPPILRPRVSTNYAEAYNAETARLLHAVLDPPLSRRDMAATIPAPEISAPPPPVTSTPPSSTRPDTRDGPANPDFISASSSVHGTSGMDRAWSVVEGMMKNKKRRTDYDGSGGEFLLVYSSAA